jgi:hypothetical protein
MQNSQCAVFCQGKPSPSTLPQPRSQDCVKPAAPLDSWKPRSVESAPEVPLSEQKRPQTKDISDLKARLGLKKGAAGADPSAPASGIASPQSPRAPTSANIAPPPGMAIAPPPGMQAASSSTQMPAAQIPNAADDPFGAMNAMAQVRTAQRAPEIVIVNDGKPVEDVSAGKQGVKYAKLAAIALVPLVLGVAIGQISKANNHKNAGIDGAKKILTVVKESKKNLNELDKKLDDLGTKTNFASSKELTDAMTKLGASLALNQDVIFSYKQNTLDASISGRTLEYFAGIAQLKGMIDSHTKAAQTDDLALAAAKKNAEDGKMKEAENAFLAGSYRYAILVNNPAAEDAAREGGLSAKLVELGKPDCDGNGTMSSVSCAGAPAGFFYRTEQNGMWISGTVSKAAPGEKIAHKSLLPLQPNGTTEALIRKAEPNATEVLYGARLRAVLEKGRKLLEEGNKLEADLTKRANAGKSFTFFL